MHSCATTLKWKPKAGSFINVVLFDCRVTAMLYANEVIQVNELMLEQRNQSRKMFIVQHHCFKTRTMCNISSNCCDVAKLLKTALH